MLVYTEYFLQNYMQRQTHTHLKYTKLIALIFSLGQHKSFKTYLPFSFSPLSYFHILLHSFFSLSNPIYHNPTIPLTSTEETTHKHTHSLSLSSVIFSHILHTQKKQPFTSLSHSLSLLSFHLPLPTPFISNLCSAYPATPTN